MAEEQRIEIEYREKGRQREFSEYMPAEEAAREFERVTRALAESGPQSDRWIKIGKTVMVRASEVHSVKLADLVLPSYDFGDPADSIWNKKF